jgi:hypothetical protein
VEAYLLLEAARADREICLKQQNLVHEIIHRNIITLQLNRLRLEKAQHDLDTADEFIGYVRRTIRGNGCPPSEYAMRGDYTDSELKSRKFVFVAAVYHIPHRSISRTECFVPSGSTANHHTGPCPSSASGFDVVLD